MAHSWLIVLLTIIIVIIALGIAFVAGFRQNDINQKDGTLSSTNVSADLSQEKKDMTIITVLEGLLILLIIILIMIIIWSHDQVSNGVSMAVSAESTPVDSSSLMTSTVSGTR